MKPCLYFACFLMIGLLGSCIETSVPSDVGRANAKLRDLYYSLKIMEQEFKLEFENIQGASFGVIADEMNRLGIVDVNAAGIGIHDPWGQEWHVRTTSTGSITLPTGTAVDDSVAVWTSGRNRINEWGSGDDLNSWEIFPEQIGRVDKR